MSNQPIAFSRLAKVQNRLNKELGRRLSLHAEITEAQTLLMIEVQNNEGCSQKQLSAALKLDTSALTGILNRISHMVRRYTNKDDRRVYVLHTTAEGEAALEIATPILRELDDSLLDRFGEEKMEEFYEVLAYVSSWSATDG